MKVGIMGFPQSGKTTLFNVLAQAHAPTGGFSGGSGGVNIGTVSVPDSRLARLRDLYDPKKYTPAQVEYVDFAGAPTEGKKGADSLYPPQLQSAEVLICAVRAFRDESVPHPFDSIDPARDIKRFGDELILKDLQIIENRLTRIEKNSRVGAGKDELREAELLRKCREALEGETPLREVEFGPDDQKLLRGFQLLSARPILFVLNIDEADLPDGPRVFGELTAAPPPPHTALVQVAARTEMELAALDGKERTEFMTLLGIEESSLDRLIRMSYDLLGLCSFFTVGPDEVRAWTIRKGTPAVEAAGAIHSDLQRGFIRAEVSRWDELLEAGSHNVLRDKGRLRVEGKDYTVMDGDILNIRFNV